jgi:3-hydroxyisobutyrate dehydrogenase-like beta-hydroxyacid dehydrogenase
MANIGFIGLGTLGTLLATHLRNEGHSLRVWNRSADKAGPLVALGAEAVTTPSDAVSPGGITFSILWDDESVEQLVSSEGFLERARGGIHVSMTTIKPDTAKKLAELHASRGSIYVEAPVFGVPQAVAAKHALFCLAGPPEAKARVRPLLESIGKQVYDFGDVGAATATKLVGNFMIITGFAAVYEAWRSLVAAGVDPKPTLDMLTNTLVATPGNQRFAASLLSGSVPPSSAIPEKDIGLFESFATSAPLASRVREIIASGAWSKR